MNTEQVGKFEPVAPPVGVSGYVGAEEMAANMRLWNEVCETNPAYTKRMEHGARLTAIMAQSQRLRATELWGPYGKTWGLRDFKWTEVRVEGQLMEMLLEAEFWCPEGAFPMATSMKWQAGNDWPLKLITHATTKSLSILGFNADVFLGRFDEATWGDNKYAEEVQKDKYLEIVEAMRDAVDMATLDKYWLAAKNRPLNAFYGAEINQVYDECKKRLAVAPPF